MESRNEVDGVALRVNTLVCGLEGSGQSIVTNYESQRGNLLVLQLPTETSIVIRNAFTNVFRVLPTMCSAL